MLARGVIKSQIGKGLDIGLAFVISILFTRALGPLLYGSYVLILGWLNMAGLLISLGFSEAISRYLPRLVAAGQAPSMLLWPLLLIRLALVALIGVLVQLTAPVLFGLLRQEALIPYVAPMIWLFALLQATALFWSFFVAQLEIELTIGANVGRHVAVLLGAGWLNWRGALSLSNVLLVVIGGYGLSLLLYGGAAWRRRWPVRPAEAAVRFGSVLGFGLSAWGVSFVTFLLSEQTDILLLGVLVTDTRSVAYYQVGTSLVWKLIGVITVGAQVVLATLSTLLERDGTIGFARGWQIFVKLSTFTVVPTYAFLGWHAPAIIRLVYGPDYAVSATLLRVFLGMLIVPFGLLAGGLNLMGLYALGRERIGLLIRVFTGTVNLILALVLIGRFGSLGAVAATGIATILGTSLEFVALRREQSLNYPWPFAGKIVAAVLIAMIPLALIEVESFAGIVVSGVAYGVAVLLLLRWWRPLSPADTALLSGLNSRLARATHWFAAA